MTERKPARLKNLTLAGISALTGCITLVVVLIALLAGLWLDSLLGQRGPATICLLVLSVPVSLFLMIRVALGLINRIQPGALSGQSGVPTSAEKED